jgi:SAM-dependent methyltransferase
LNSRLGGVNWDAVFEERLARASFVGHGSRFWARHSTPYNESPFPNPYVSELLSRLTLRRRDKILDVGAGTGALTIPLARRVARVTAVESSRKAAGLLREAAKKQCISNLTILQKDWLDTRTGTDFLQHDVVIASRALPLGNLRKSLELMSRAAKRYACFTWRLADEDDAFAKVCHILKREYVGFPEFIIPYNMLFEMGFIASVELFSTHMHQSYKTLDEAVRAAVRQTEISAEDRARLSAGLAKKLTRTKSGYEQDVQFRWALVIWDTSTVKSRRHSPPMA